MSDKPGSVDAPDELDHIDELNPPVELEPVATRLTPKRIALIAVGVVVVIAVVVALVALRQRQNDGLADAATNGSNLGYTVGDGAIETFAANKRDAPVVFTTKDSAGNTIRSKDLLGKVTIVNFWYAACAPCRVEAPLLEKAAQSYAGKPVDFLGVNVRDSAETVESVMKGWGISYPSAIDASDGNVLLAFASKVPANAVPVTIVLDEQGRIAARFVGQLQDTSSLSIIVDDVIAEGA